MSLERVLERYAEELQRALEECGCKGIDVEKTGDPVAVIVKMVVRAEAKCKGAETARCVLEKMADAVKLIVREVAVEQDT